MPLFLSEEELRLDTVCAEAEETCALLDQVSEKLASELAAGPELAADLAELIQQYERQVSILKHEKEILAKSKRNQQEYIKRLERDWAELKNEVQEQRDHVRVLTLDKKSVFDGCMKQVEDMRKELQNSWKASNDAASRAAVAEIIFRDVGHDNSSATEANNELFRQKEELKKYEEAQANKSYMLQYKEIVSSNEAALKQMESAYQDYKTESEIAKQSLEDEIAKLRNNLSEMEKSYVMKCEETASAMEAKEKDITTLMNDIAILRNEVTQKVARTEILEIELASSKSALDEQCKHWRSAQDNYERQVILQSETIQELTNTSRQLSSLQQEIAILRQTADAQKAENDALRTFGEQEKIELVKEKDEALRKYNELNDQAAELLQVQRPEAQLSHSGGLHQVPPEDDKSPPTRCNASPPTTTVPVSFRHPSTDRRAHRNITSIKEMVAEELLLLINYGDMEELTDIKGIRDNRAENIIKFRSELSFKSLKDLEERMNRNQTPLTQQRIEDMIDGFAAHVPRRTLPTDADNNPQAGGLEAGGDSNKSKLEINDEDDSFAPSNDE